MKTGRTQEHVTAPNLVDYEEAAYSPAEIKPFAVDPYDAIGTFAFQIAVELNIVSFAHSFQPRNNTNSLHSLPFILCGFGLAICFTVITILRDGIVVAKQ